MDGNRMPLLSLILFGMTMLVSNRRALPGMWPLEGLNLDVLLSILQQGIDRRGSRDSPGP